MEGKTKKRRKVKPYKPKFNQRKYEELIQQDAKEYWIERCAQTAGSGAFEADNDQNVLTEFEETYNQAVFECQEAILKLKGEER